MTARIVAIERTGAATPDFGDWRPITVRDDSDNARALFGHIQVHGIADDGTRHALLGYYSDESTYQIEELRSLLIGAEIEDAKRLAGGLRVRRDLDFAHDE
jgi:hypothetical protein